MINLLPTIARQGVQREYWLRVVTVWLLLLSGAFGVASLLLLPPYVLIGAKADVYKSSADEIAAEVASYEDVSSSLTRANQQATFLTTEVSLVKFSDLIALFRSFESDTITLSNIQLSRVDTAIETIVLGGTASNRQALAGLRDELLAHGAIKEVELPISNLAQDVNIPFMMNIVLHDNEAAL